MRLRCPDRWRGPQWVGGTSTQRHKYVPPDSIHSPPFREPTVRRPLGLPARTPGYQPAFSAYDLAPSGSEWGSPARCLLSILLPHFTTSPHPPTPHAPREQVSRPRGSYSPLPVSPSPPHPLADRWEKQEGTAGLGHLFPPGQSGPHGPGLGGALGSQQRGKQLWGPEERSSKVKERCDWKA